MHFKIKPLKVNAVSHLFGLNDAELAAQNACRQTVTSHPGTPCRVSMQDAAVGETVILLNYAHQPEAGPYQACHAVFVREGAEPAEIEVNEVPEVIRSRLISLRFFDRDHMMIDANVVPGPEVADELMLAFDKDDIAYVHLHNAKPGCFAASAFRAE